MSAGVLGMVELDFDGPLTVARVRRSKVATLVPDRASWVSDGCYAAASDQTLSTSPRFGELLPLGWGGHAAA
jgi:hypothetical protein